jgi:hypothetical protein
VYFLLCETPWPFVYTCDMDAAFSRIEVLKWSGTNSETAFKVVLGLTWLSSTFSDHYRVWKACPSGIIVAAVHKGWNLGGEWKPLTKLY